MWTRLSSVTGTTIHHNLDNMFQYTVCFTAALVCAIHVYIEKMHVPCTGMLMLHDVHLSVLTYQAA